MSDEVRGGLLLREYASVAASAMDAWHVDHSIELGDEPDVSFSPRVRPTRCLQAIASTARRQRFSRGVRTTYPRWRLNAALSRLVSADAQTARQREVRHWWLEEEVVEAWRGVR